MMVMLKFCLPQEATIDFKRLGQRGNFESYHFSTSFWILPFLFRFEPRFFFNHGYCQICMVLFCFSNLAITMIKKKSRIYKPFFYASINIKWLCLKSISNYKQKKGLYISKTTNTLWILLNIASKLCSAST